ncbi:MAG: ABC transporter permease subunit [Thermoguttaceae bacterium]
MLPGPLFSVELVTSARRARYWVIRVLYAGLLLLFLCSTYIEYYRLGQNNIGTVANLTAQFFEAFAWLQLLTVAFLGPGLVAGTIAQERERRTIEYLFATPLRNSEIVLGKLAARLVHLVYIVLVGVPVLAIAMLQGGIAPEALAVLLVVTVSTMLVLAALSIAVSVWSPRAREAVTRAYLLVLVLLLLPPIVASMSGTAFYAWLGPINEQLLAGNPFWLLTEILSLASSSGAATEWTLVGTLVRNQMILTVAATACAMLAVRRVHLRRAGAAPRKRLRWLRFFRPALGQRPMLWKELFAEPAAARLGTLGVIALFLLLLAAITPGACMVFDALQSSQARASYQIDQCVSYAWVMGDIVSCGALLLIAVRAAGSVTSEKERQCWDSLLGTPLEAREILWAKVLGNLWAVRGVLVALLLVWCPAGLLAPSFLAVIPFLLGVLLPLALFASILGLMFSLWCRTSLRAMGATLATALFLGGGYFILGSFCCVPFMMMMPGGPGRGVEIFLAPCVPFLLAFPGIVYSAGDQLLRNEEGGIFLFAFGLGITGYVAAATVIFFSLESRFDALASRAVNRGLRRVHPFQSPGGLVLAELVDEAKDAPQPGGMPSE